MKGNGEFPEQAVLFTRKRTITGLHTEQRLAFCTSINQYTKPGEPKHNLLLVTPMSPQS